MEQTLAQNKSNILVNIKTFTNLRFCCQMGLVFVVDFPNQGNVGFDKQSLEQF